MKRKTEVRGKQKGGGGGADPLVPTVPTAHGRMCWVWSFEICCRLFQHTGGRKS